MGSPLPIRNWTIAQHFAVWLGLSAVGLGVIGLAINPDFAIGDDATAEKILGVDWNGWHGVAAIMVGVPGVAVMWNPSLALLYLAARGLADAAAGTWALVDDNPLGVLYLPASGDVIVHVGIAGLCVLGILFGITVGGRATRPAA